MTTILLLAVGAFLLKEALVVATPVLLMAALSSRAERWWKVGTAGLLVLVAIVICVRAVAISSAAGPAAYSRGFDVTSITWVNFIASLLPLVLPNAWPWLSLGDALTQLVTPIWLLMIVVGVIRAMGSRAAMVTALCLTLGGATLVYTAWGRIEPFYAIPFVTLLVTLPSIETRRRTEVLIVLAAIAITPSLALEAARYKESTRARRLAEFEVASAIARLDTQDTVFILESNPPPQQW